METKPEVIRIKDCDPNFMGEVLDAGGEKAKACFQCGTCTAGCPTMFAWDYTLRQIMHMVALGIKEKVLSSNAIWYCASCNTCTTRCPRGVKVTDVMGALKNIAIREGYLDNKKGPAFYKSFLEVTERNGRIFEPEIMLRYSLKTNLKHLIKEAPLGLAMFRKGKVGLLPDRVKNKDQLNKIFENVRKMESEE